MKNEFVVSIVDDDSIVREALSDLIKSLGYEAITFKSAEDLLESDQVARTACVITDLQMPGLTGLEVQRILAGAGVRFPTIIITAHDEPETRARCLSAGAAAYLCKPLHDEMLLDAIAEAVGRPVP